METLTREEIEFALADLNDWAYSDEALVRTFRFADFVHAIDFVDRLAQVAEDRQHHPDIDVRYNKVTLHVSTHDAGGVTVRDVDLAQAAEHLV
jgi:4a-hydroxytetrahydrobiopterin dehydratase